MTCAGEVTASAVGGAVGEFRRRAAQNFRCAEKNENQAAAFIKLAAENETRERIFHLRTRVFIIFYRHVVQFFFQKIEICVRLSDYELQSYFLTKIS